MRIGDEDADWFVGRPLLYAIGARGNSGLTEMMDLLVSQIDISLAQLGCPDINDIDASFVIGREPIDYSAELK